MLVEQIMRPKPVTVTPGTTLGETLERMRERGVRHLPVVEHDRLLGIVTETDVLELFVRALGAGEPSSRLDVRLGSGRSALAEVVHTVEGAGAAISSIMTLVGPDGTREVVVRVPTINPLPAVRALEGKGYSVTTPWRGTLT